VFVPALFVWRALLVPDRWTLPVVAAMLLASGFGFNRDDAKTSDHFFTGFPSYWNVVVFYLAIAGWPTRTNAAVLIVCAMLVFVPFRYLYPSRTPIVRRSSNALGIIWGVLLLVLLWQYPLVSRWVFYTSLLYPAYYVLLSVIVDAQRRRGVIHARAGGGP